MTFLGFTINSRTGDVVDKKSGKILQANIMSPKLFQCLTLQGVNLERDFDQLSRYALIDTREIFFNRKYI